MKYSITTALLFGFFGLFSQALTITYTKKDVLCKGASTGEIHATITGGTKPYTIEWDDDASLTTLDRLNLPAGSYSLSVTDSVGGYESKSMYIEQPFDGISISTIVTNPTSAGGNGKIELFVDGENPPFTYKWSTSPPQTTKNLSAPAGTYTCTVTDSKGCTETETETIDAFSSTADLLPPTIQARLVPAGSPGVFALNVSEEISGECFFEVLDVSGKSVLRRENARNGDFIELVGAPSGVFIAYFRTERGSRLQRFAKI